VSNSKNTGVELHPESFVYSQAKETYAKWEYQKRRHLTTGGKYKFHHLVMLGLYSMSQYTFWVTLIALLFNPEILPLLALVIVAKLLLQGTIMGTNMFKLKVMDLFLLSWLLEPLLLLFYMRVALLNIVKQDQRKRWV
jgi:hypothetical protein